MVSFDVGRMSRLAAGCVGGLGVFTSLVTSVQSVHQLLDENFWYVLLVGWGFAVAASFPPPVSRRIGFTPPTNSIRDKFVTYLRFLGQRFTAYLLVLLITGACASLGYWRYYKTHLQVEQGKLGEPEPIPPKSGAFWWGLLGGDAWAAQPSRPIGPDKIGVASKKPEGTKTGGGAVQTHRVLQFALSSGKSSYYEAPSTPGARTQGNQSAYIATYRLLEGIDKIRQEGGCLLDFSNRAETSRAALKQYLRTKPGKIDLIKFVNEGDFLSLTRRQPKEAMRMLPQGKEWKDLPSGDYDAILDWAVSCIGITHPVFRVTLENPRDEQVTITRIYYEIEDVNNVTKGTTHEELIQPMFIVAHMLPAERGSFCQDIPPVSLPPKRPKSFELQLSGLPKASDAVYTMKLSIEASKPTGRGLVFTTDRFRVSLSGRSSGARFPIAQRCVRP
jgi:hypothetical protein